MNQQESETVDCLSSKENDGQVFFEFADLNLTDTQLAEIKGGPSAGSHTSNQGWGKWEVNHNETAAEDEEIEPEALADLPVEDDAQVKAGWEALCGKGKTVQIAFLEPK